MEPGSSDPLSIETNPELPSLHARRSWVRRDVAVDSVCQIVGEKLVNYPLQGVPSPLTARTVLRDRHGGLWIGTHVHGIVHSYEGKTFLFTHGDGLTSDRVIALFEDREGTIWVATPKGLDQFRESPVGSLSVNAGLSSATTTSILAARDGSIWIGTADGLNRWKDGRTRIYRTRSDPGLPDDSIQSLFEDESGRIWVSGFRGLAVFENGRFTAVPSVPAGIVHAIASDNHGGLWLSMWLTADDYGLVHLVGRQNHGAGAVARARVVGREPASSPTRTAASGQGC